MIKITINEQWNVNEVHFTRCSFYFNTGVNGGSLYTSINVIVNITSCSFHSNKAQNGGSIYAAKPGTQLKEATSPSLYINDTLFDADEATSNGGSIYSEITTIILNSNFTSTTSVGKGSSIYLLNSEGSQLSGIGIMLDDVFAGMFAAVLIYLLAVYVL